MNRLANILTGLIAMAFILSCQREAEMPGGALLPEGTPISIVLGFGAEDLQDVQIGTKAEVGRSDESNVHDLYVLIFEKEGGTKIYGRYFTFEHVSASLSSLLAQESEGWYVENVALGETDASKKTRGVVKLSTVSKSTACQVVVIANVENTIMSINGKDGLEWLSSSITLGDLEEARVTLDQNIVNRANLFLMMGKMDVENTSMMAWNKSGGKTTDSYGTDYRVALTPLDAKVKFRVRYDKTNISGITPRFWKVYNVPDRCMLFPSSNTPSQVGMQPFNTEEAYFETTETEGEDTYQVFAFYMLETKPFRKFPADSYAKRDLLEKNDDGTNKESWAYAPQNGTYVCFDVILNLTKEGIRHILDDPETNHALTSDALFTVHLGDFTSSESGSGHNYDDYSVLRGHAYTYNITIINSKSIYVEVVKGQENEPGQEGSLLLTTDEIINCDAHYEYHDMAFKANAELATAEAQKKLSWYTKTPFAEGGPEPMQDGKYVMPMDGDGHPETDCLWVKFGLNKKEGDIYTENRSPYPGDTQYNPDWDPTAWDPETNPVPEMIDINQLINLLFDQNTRKVNGAENLFDSLDEIRFTAFVNEYYYEVNPLTGELDPDLWRTFINAKPRELHILSDAEYSADRKSDVIRSSHSIIQNSIQTFYNVYSPDLSSIWGTEHKDEMRNRGANDSSTGVSKSWPWWHDNFNPTGVINDDENGRVNTYNIWELNYEPHWDTFLDYEVNNDTPELKPNYQYMAYSCLTRNRDNNGNGIIDQDELRWYTASINQLIGLWIGNESLSVDSRLYQPADASSSDPLKWRAHVVSSTCSGINNPRVIRAEEGSTKSLYNNWSWAFPDGSPQEYRDRVASVRCVRNAGTFRKNGVPTDISYAPYDQGVDLYYEAPMGTDHSGKLVPNPDGTYTVHFTHLNPKSIREYTAEDLPYHEEYSALNCVYLKLDMQNPEEYLVRDGKLNLDERALNNNISKAGYNPYCPPGYRLPSMTELLVMSNLLPQSYWKQSGITVDLNYPCRSYFSRGYLGGSRQVPTEKNKIGWHYSTNTALVNLINDGSNVSAVRCVRDKDMTGDITGKVIVENYNSLHAGEETTITLNFSSMASAIRKVDLSLVWVDKDGSENVKHISEADKLHISGVTLREDIRYTFPENLNVSGWMKVRAQVFNAMGMERTFEADVRIVSDATLSIKLLPCEYPENDFPVLLTAYDKDHVISDWRLKIVSPDKSSQTIGLGSYDKEKNYVTYVYPFAPNPLQEGTYTFQLEADCDEVTVRSEVVSMDVLKVNYRPVPEEVAAAAEKASDLAAYSWEREIVSGLDFVAGDFIETDMDISSCLYKSYDGEDDLGLDTIFSVGLNDIEWVPWVFNVQFPSVSPKERELPNPPRALYLNPTWLEGKSTKNKGDRYNFPDVDKPAHFRIEKGGLFWNGEKIDIGRWGANQVNVQNVVDKLTAANTLYVGSTMGTHSRALYRFVRVVHNGRDSSIEGGDSNFKEDPGYGGDL